MYVIIIFIICKLNHQPNNPFINLIRILLGQQSDDIEEVGTYLHVFMMSGYLHDEKGKLVTFVNKKPAYMRHIINY